MFVFHDVLFLDLLQGESLVEFLDGLLEVVETKDHSRDVIE